MASSSRVTAFSRTRKVLELIAVGVDDRPVAVRLGAVVMAVGLAPPNWSAASSNSTTSGR